MKAAKIIALIAFVINSLFTIYAIFIFVKIRPVFQEVGIQTPPGFIFILPVFAVVTLIYWFYLRNRGKKGEVVRFALWVSIGLLLIPWLFFYPAVIVILLRPLYNLWIERGIMP